MPFIRTSPRITPPPASMSGALGWSRSHRLIGTGRRLDHAVIIPAFNEAERIKPTIESIYDHFSSRHESRFEVIVVDDGSRDNTREKVLGMTLDHPDLVLTPRRQNFGKGFSVKQGMLASTAARSLFMDADGSTPISELDKLEDAFESGYDIAIGSRWAAGADIRLHQPFYREAMGQTFRFIVKMAAGLDIDDTQCGFKGFTRDAAADIFLRQKVDRFAFDVEVLFLAQKLGYKIAEIPITWTNSPSSKVNPFTDPAKMFLDVMRVRWMHRGDR